MSDRQLANSQLGSLEYDPAPESAAIAKLKPSYGLFIDGAVQRRRRPTSSSPTVNPANEETLSMVAQAEQPPTSIGPSRRRVAPTTRSGPRRPARNARSTSFASPD